MKKLAELYAQSWKEMRHLRTMTTSAMFMAISVVLGYFTIEAGPYLKIGLGSVANQFVYYLFGPVTGMFYAGILVTISLPLSLKYIGKYLEAVEEHYLPAVIIFAILGVLALLLVNELRKMFGTVLAENCFVPENVASLRRMGDLSFFIAAMSAVRCVVYLTIAMLVIILVFIIAGMFSKVLAMVFEEAVRYKEENDLTI